MTLTKRLRTLTAGPPWATMQVIEFSSLDNATRVLDRLGALYSSHIRVVLLYCEPKGAQRIFQAARKLNLLDGDWVWLLLDRPVTRVSKELQIYPPGMLGLQLRTPTLSQMNIRSVVEVVWEALETLGPELWFQETQNDTIPVSCWAPPTETRQRMSTLLFREMRRCIRTKRRALQSDGHHRDDHTQWGPLIFDVFNLVPKRRSGGGKIWKSVGNVTRHGASLESVLWLGQSKMGPPPTRRPRFRIVTAYAPPFVKASSRVGNGSCLMGVPCLQVATTLRSDIITIFADYYEGKNERRTYNICCCAGITIELMETVSRDLAFDYDLYLVSDGVFGNLRGRKWNGMTHDLVTGAAHMAFSAYSITSSRAEVIDFSVPYFHSGVSCLTNAQYNDVPLSVFLVPFSVQLWVAIFASLNAAAIAAALYEWFSPFGLNPWGRQRTKNFSLASALWVMWSLLFSHLVAFKAPKSWPNKVLINLWGCFSVIFLASYTANIAALFAGLFFTLRVDDFHDASLLSKRTGTAKSSAAESYVYSENPKLWQHIQLYGVSTLEEGLYKLKNDELDVLIGDTAVLNYFRGNDPNCSLHQGDSIFDDAYGIAMQKRFPLKEAISHLILKYNDYGYLDQLEKKWYGRVPCFDDSVQRMLKRPMSLTVQAVAGAFIMLIVGVFVGVAILFVEHSVFKYALPVLRTKPKDCYWRNPNLMFFSQKMYRFINTVELVSPHHSAKEIVSNLRDGQIASLFQKSVKRKAKEEARRRKSKSQFFEMIQEIRKMVAQQQSSDPVEVHQARMTLLQISPMERLKTPEESQRLLSPVTCHPPCTPSNSVNHPVATALGNEPSTGNALPNLRNRFVCLPDDSKGKLLRSLSGQQGSYSSESASPGSEYSGCSSFAFRQACKLQRSGVSVSLEDISSPQRSESPSFVSPATNVTSYHHQTVRSWSCDDFKTLRERSSEPRTASSVTPWRQVAGFQKASRSKMAMEELRFYAMTKEEILQQWRVSERELLNLLCEALRDKKALEEKLTFIQQTLLKPP